MTLEQSELVDLAQVAHRLADAARPASLAYFRQGGQGLENKLADGFDPVTQADRDAEQAMRAVLAELRPHDAIFGEEFGAKDGTSGLTWVLDPIDGTRGYISGTPTWGVLIAVHDGTRPVLGIIDQPFTRERFVGYTGLAQWQRDTEVKPLGTRVCDELAAATLLSTFPEIGTEQDRHAFQKVSGACRLTRYGMDCYGYALLAAGQVDLVIEAGLSSYDIQAPIAVIEAAGGIVTNWEGGPVDQGGRALAAGSKSLHEQAMELLNS